MLGRTYGRSSEKLSANSANRVKRQAGYSFPEKKAVQPSLLSAQLRARRQSSAAGPAGPPRARQRGTQRRKAARTSSTGTRTSCEWCASASPAARLVTRPSALKKHAQSLWSAHASFAPSKPRTLPCGIETFLPTRTREPQLFLQQSVVKMLVELFFKPEEQIQNF